MLTLFAQARQALINGADLVRVVVYLVVFGLIFWLLWWLISYCALPEPFNKVARVILAVAAVLLIISVLLGLAGVPIVAW